jgi:hypothetical protein
MMTIEVKTTVVCTMSKEYVDALVVEANSVDKPKVDAFLRALYNAIVK